MSTLGQFLEFSVPAADPGASLDFYRRLGFSEIRVNDVRPAGYAAVTDGQIVIGLHGSGLDEPALTFVHPGLARHARALIDGGTDLVFQRLDADQFHEVQFRSPDGHLLQLLEAPTFSVTDDEYPAPVIGRCIKLELGCDSLEDSQTFFERGGFLGSEGDGDDNILLATPGLSMVLRSPVGASSATLCFEPTGAWQSLLEERGINPRRTGSAWLLTAPEGTPLRLE
ncbi:MAG: hypothetical protein R3F24_01570 [Gammaproteobacteria bacterium]